MWPYYTIYHTWWIVNCSQFAMHTHTNTSNSWLRSSCIQNDIYVVLNVLVRPFRLSANKTTTTKKKRITRFEYECYVDPFPYLFSVMCLRRKRYTHRTHWKQESKSERDWEQENIIAPSIKCIGKKGIYFALVEKQNWLFLCLILNNNNAWTCLPLSHWIQMDFHWNSWNCFLCKLNLNGSQHSVCY